MQPLRTLYNVAHLIEFTERATSLFASAKIEVKKHIRLTDVGCEELIAKAAVRCFRKVLNYATYALTGK